MANRSLHTLPPEILLSVLSHLPLQPLLAYGATCKYAHRLSESSMREITLGAYPNRLSAIMSMLSATPFNDLDQYEAKPPASQSNGVAKQSPSLEQATTVIQPTRQTNMQRSPTTATVHVPLMLQRDVQTLFAFQNALSISILQRYAGSLRVLSLSVFQPTPALIDALAGLRNLRHLALRCDHPHSRVPAVPRNFWESCTDSEGTMWNRLGEPGVWGNLEEILLERVGITAWQFARILHQNKKMQAIKVKKCDLLGREFWQYLTGMAGRAQCNESIEHIEREQLCQVTRNQLKVLWFTAVKDKTFDERALQGVEMLPGLLSLSLQSCNMNNEAVETLNQDVWHIPDLTLPQPLSSEQTGKIEVDPAFTAG